MSEETGETAAAQVAEEHKTEVAEAEQQAEIAKPKIRHDWYQTETHVVVTLLVKNVDKEKFKVEYGAKSVVAHFPLSSGEEAEFTLHLLHEISTEGNIHKVFSSKVEIKLKKLEGFRWNTLESVGETGDSKPTNMAEVAKYPSSSLKQHDWDKVASTIEDDEPQGEAALNALFSKIYSSGNDELRKAMNKSFQESGGTVLSTNWDEVKKGKVNVQPPQGMEWKKWDT